MSTNPTTTARPSGRVSHPTRIGAARRRRLFAHELANVLRIAGPIVVSQLGTVGMNTVDTLMVGPLGAVSLASVAVASAIQSILLMVTTGVIHGMTPLVSQAFGAGDGTHARRVLVQGLWLSVALSIPIAWISLEGTALLVLAGQEREIAELGGAYMQALAWGLFPALAFMALRVYLEGIGEPRAPMVVTLAGLGLNIVANAVFIHGAGGVVPAMGAVGAGWATTFVRWAMLALLLGYVTLRPRLHPFRDVAWRPHAPLLRRITAVGAPVGAQMGLEVGLFSLAAVMMGWIGPVELAAHQVTINIAATTFMIALGASLAGSIRVGHHIGARNHRGVRRAVAATYLLALAFMTACAITFVAAPELLLGLYTDDAEILAIGTTLLTVAAVFQLFDGAQVSGISVLRGAADTRAPMLVAALGYWAIGLPLAYTLGFHTDLGPVGIWLGLAAALGAVAVLLGIRVRRVLWTKAEAL